MKKGVPAPTPSGTADTPSIFDAALFVPDAQTVLIRYPEQLFVTALLVEITDPAVQSVQIVNCFFEDILLDC